MNVEQAVARMAESAAAIRAVTLGITDEQARWKPDPESWSVLEVVNHLWDEEREDFRQRIDYTLHRPGEEWPPIDPMGWVDVRRYNERDLAESFEGFLAAREDSLAWLRALRAPDWEATYQAPWGAISAGDLLASWVAHDLLHLRQLVELRWLLTTSELAPRNVRYAGEW
ncbi:MAG TPA: DinB family protein [Anaerolineae bacterium]|nr:DinB family protein [Anaerolineae bacterium]